MPAFNEPTLSRSQLCQIIIDKKMGDYTSNLVDAFQFLLVAMSNCGHSPSLGVINACLQIIKNFPGSEFMVEGNHLSEDFFLFFLRKAGTMYISKSRKKGNIYFVSCFALHFFLFVCFLPHTSFFPLLFMARSLFFHVFIHHINIGHYSIGNHQRAREKRSLIL